ncbi:mitochondrial substrate carrier family protein C-like isoform X1 [Phoenix dactylifera]|uniref:Mitochondrial substrate carrier family protein C-like isoform X1 n=1 Tax=Phoenix dactylifera TaxID=42345 RepID=A0A8B7BRB7_PHODC|nr:mitochondrial substrate carrier family protein C-like isoform X1 [Phoenix dactylifera]
MVSGDDPVESFLHAVRDAFSPLESGFLRAAKDLESHWLNSRRNEAKNGEFLDVFHGSAKKQPGRDAVVAVAVLDERKTGSAAIKIPIKSFFGALFPKSSGGNAGAGGRKGEASKKEASEGDGDGSCANCLHFAMTWSLLFNSFLQVFPSPFKSAKKCFGKQCGQEDDPFADPMHVKPRRRGPQKIVFWRKSKDPASEDRDTLSLELLLSFAFESLVQNLHMFDLHCHEKSSKSCGRPPPQFDYMNVIKGLIDGKKADFDGFLSSMRFARVGGAPGSLAGATPSAKEEGEGRASSGDREETESSSPHNFASGLLNIPLSNVERLKSTLSTVSLTELIEFIPQLGKSSSTDHPDKKKLFSVQDFFRYTEAEGKRFFEELDRDGDGQVTVEDLEIAMRKRRLPKKYARDFLRRTRSNIFSKSIGWKQFLSLMEQKEPTMLRAYTTLCLSKSGTLQKNQILTSLRSAGLPANEDNAVAMLRYLNADTEGSISYSHFRNFMLLLPSERLEDDPRSIWFEAATLVAVPPPVEISAENVLKSALAGGLACALSTSVMHPIDTIKTRVQASTLSFPELISKLPQIGLQGLYRGSIPAILGQFSSHGLRTGIFEASKLVLINVAPTLPDFQVQSLSSFCSTILGTAVRIPCEVLKQRLQAGIFDNVGEAIVGTMRQDGLKGFFRGTGATLCREVPFYVAGMGLYAEAKKAAQNLLNRDLEPWETVIVGALSGGLAAVITTPFDVMKTRMMTAPQGRPISMQMVAFSILRKEGPSGLFKGAVPRFFWIAPLGAMNFAGYELAKKAMDKSEHMAGEQLHEKRMAGSG